MEDQASAPAPGDQQPVLIAIEGPVRGTVFPLQYCPLTIGRKSDNGIAVPDSSISRRHCAITRQLDGYVITDLDSQNGTIVNGVPVKERVLAPGDQIQVGECLFVFSFGAGKRPEPGLTLANDDAAELSTVIMPAESGARLTARFSPGENEASRLEVLEALVRISSSINCIRGVGPLSERLLAELFDAVPLERGALVLGLDRPTDPQRVFAYDRRLRAIAPFPISRAVLERCLQENVSILSENPDSQCETAALETTVTPVVRPLVAAPLTIFGKVSGLIYMDSCHEGVRVDRFHLQFVTAAAAIGAAALDNAMRLEYLESEKERLEAEINVRHALVGESPAIQEVHRFLSRVAPLNTTVLISGESGTGKELVARALHRNSSRAGKPFVAINCAAITETLLESELFGYEKGAFTGAFARKPGKLETADGGTLFLDEVGELALSLQAKLLRVIQEREFERVGGTHALTVDIRIVAATNRDLKDAVTRRSFREDLYYGSTWWRSGYRP
jgi:transcriptional regulator with GAF, ATPase, and Fis domain